jgi:glutathione S-transferase
LRIEDTHGFDTLAVCHVLIHPIALAAGAYSIADIHLFRLFWRLRGSVGADPATFPGLSAHHDRMMQRAAVQRTFVAEAVIGYDLTA